MTKPKQEPVELVGRFAGIRLPRPGDVINPAGDLMLETGVTVTSGVIMLTYRKGLLALRYGWRIHPSTNGDFMVVYR